jgi:hypothetical protein
VSPIPHLGLIILAIGLPVAIALIAVGIVRLLKVANALKVRVDGYADLPIKGYVDRSTTKIERASQSIGRASGLVYRARAVQRDLANAFAKIAAVLVTPASLWRLGEVLLTGKTRS